MKILIYAITQQHKRPNDRKISVPERYSTFIHTNPSPFTPDPFFQKQNKIKQQQQKSRLLPYQLLDYMDICTVLH